LRLSAPLRQSLNTAQGAILPQTKESREQQMTEAPELPLIQPRVRTEPIQQRSAQRVTLLLDAAAALIDENGIDGLTTSDVAARSESSVGVVYRYFPNIQSLLRALAARNMQQFTDRVFSALVNDAADWRNSLDASMDAFVDMNRTTPGFRALRFGDVIDERFLEPELSNNAVLARAFSGLLAEKYGFAPDSDLVFSFEVVIEVADALLKRAFLLEKNGDERFISTAREVVRDYLRDHATLPEAS
jgi:AcrR family transcriptional regulator